LLFIGNCNGPAWGAWYKGVDLLLETFKIAESHIPGLTLDIVGDWDESSQAMLRSKSGTTGLAVTFLGRLSDVRTKLAESALYVHLARGDAFPISVLEAMLAGVPTLVSEQTGTREAVARVDDRLVVPNDPAIAAERIRWYLGLDAHEKDRLSNSCREVAECYTEDKSVHAFVTAVDCARRV
jgi:glycosyltransferase involved in cell wall biosynthesis